ncbi:hypothetical protein [Streptomyces massasporeus]|uniref:hypothetical protein n=1 Tax=Streptomyces massasporeus TaxID=67324 RepID=UPI00380D2D18
MNQPSIDPRDFIHAADELTKQVRRIADAFEVTAVEHVLADDDGPTAGCTSACQGVTGIRGLLEHVGVDTTGQDITVAGRIVDPAPATDEDALRATRRESARVILDRATRGIALRSDESALLRQHFDAETREHDTARSVARSNLRHVKTLVPELEAHARENEQLLTDLHRLRTELEQAQSRVRQLETDYATVARWRNEQAERADQAEELLRIAHETSNRSETERASAQADVERVRTLATDAQQRCRQRRDDYETGRYDLATALLDALDGTEQPTTEAPSTCTATIPDALGSAALHRCTAPAGHYDESDEPVFTGETGSPGGWHTDGEGHAWSDRAAAATPHGQQPTTEA